MNNGNPVRGSMSVARGCASALLLENRIKMNTIDYLNLGTGLLLIVMGWLCYRFPNMINPYGNMSPERKALVDIEGLKRSTAIIMTVAGGLLLFTVLLSYLKYIDENMSGLLLTVIGIAMIIPLFIAMHRHNGFGRDRSGVLTPEQKKQKYSKLAWVIVGVSMVFVVVILLFASKPTKIEVGEESISISGMYGREIPISGIVSVELLEKMPSIAVRTNGSSTGRYNKGHFRLSNGENCLLFTRNQAPYIELRTTDNLYYINGDTEEETIEILSKIKEKALINQ